MKRGDRHRETHCVSRLATAPLGGSAGTVVREKVAFRRRLKARASPSSGSASCFLRVAPPDSRPFPRGEPFLSRTLRALPCPRRPALHFRPFPPLWLGWLLPFIGDFSSGNFPHLPQGCFIQPSSLFLSFLSFLPKRPLFRYWTLQTHSLSPTFPLQLLRRPFHPAAQAPCCRLLSPSCSSHSRSPLAPTQVLSLLLPGRVSSWHSPFPPACFFISVFSFLSVTHTLSAEV